MEIIRHRINTLAELNQLDVLLGAELDIRSRNGNIILSHEPHRRGDLFKDYLSCCVQSHRPGTLILNVKEDGLEEDILRLLSDIGINKYFFLDLSIPTTVRLCFKNRIRNVAIRVSEYETIESALQFKGVADWVWLDSFSGKPPGTRLAKTLKRYFKICLVSPELEGHPPEQIHRFRTLIPYADAVCTKYDGLWK